MSRFNPPAALRGAQYPAADGTLARPSYRFIKEPGTGISRNGAGRFAISVLGQRSLEVTQNDTFLRAAGAASVSPLGITRLTAPSADGQEMAIDFYEASTQVGRLASYRQSATQRGFRWYTYDSGTGGLPVLPTMVLSGDQDLSVARYFSAGRIGIRATGPAYMIQAEANATGAGDGISMNNAVAGPTWLRMTNATTPGGQAAATSNLYVAFGARAAAGLGAQNEGVIYTQGTAALGLLLGAQNVIRQRIDPTTIRFLSSAGIERLRMDDGVAATFRAVAYAATGGIRVEHQTNAALYAGLWVDSDGSAALAGPNGSVRLLASVNAFAPSADNVTHLGQATLRWNTVYASAISGLSTLSVSGALSSGSLSTSSISGLAALTLSGLMTSGSISTGAITCTTINTQSNTITAGAINCGNVGCGAITCTTINTQNNTITTGAINATGVITAAALTSTANVNGVTGNFSGQVIGASLSIASGGITTSGSVLTAGTLTSGANVNGVTGNFSGQVIGASANFGVGQVNCGPLVASGNGSFGSVQISSGAAGWYLVVGNDGVAKPTAGSWFGTSDLRSKVASSIRPYEQGLETIRKMDPVYFEHNGRYGMPVGIERIGLVADHVRPHAPEMIHTARAKIDPANPKSKEEDYLAIDITPLTYMLINAVKELADELDALKGRLL